MGWFKRLKKRFYAGPVDLGLRLKGKRGYQSPTVTAAAWLAALAVRHLTLSGRVTALCCIVLVPYSLITSAMPVYMLGLSVVSLFCVDGLMGWFLRPKLTMERVFPARVADGAEIAVIYSITNSGRRCVVNLRIDTLPFPGMVKRLSLDPVPAVLKPGESMRISGRWLAKGRGAHHLPALRCVCAYPFGLWSWGVSSQRTQPLLVYPRFTPLTRVSLAVGEIYQPSGESLSNKAGMSMEFLGCREFRDGDDLRRLHMRSWARTGIPVVKEFRQEYMARAGIIVDTFLPRRLFEELRERFEPRPAFEASLSLSAGIVDFFAGHDCRIDLFAAGATVHHLGGGHGLSYLDRVLDILADLEFTTQDEFGDLKEKLTPYLALTSGVVFILCGWNEEREAVISHVRESGVDCLVLLVRKAARRVEKVPGYVQQISVEDIVGGRCAAL